MKSISIYLSLFLGLCIFQQAVSQDGSDAVYNKLIKEYTLNDDGSSEYREYKEVRLLSHMSFHRLFGETFIIYDPEYQELKVNAAYTIMADGKKVMVPDNAFNEVLPRAAAHAAPYNHLREMVITHTGLEVGATIYLDYSLKSKAGYMPAFMGEEEVGEAVPVKDKQLIVNIPGGQELRYSVLNIRTAPEIREGNGMKTYTFGFKELKANSHEWGLDIIAQPRIFFSSAKDLERAYFPFVGQKAFTYPVNPYMRSAVEKLKDDNNDGPELALSIQKMVVNDIANWRLPLEYTGFRCRTPEEVWASNAGTKLEKTVLLATLLQAAGYRAVPVAIIPEKYFDRKVGSLYMMKDFAVQLKTGGDIFYLSAGQLHKQDLAFSLAGNKLLVLDGAIESIRATDPASLRSEIIYEGKFTNDANEQIKGTMDVKLVGALNPFFSLSEDTAYAKRYAGGVQDVQLNILNHNESAFTLDIAKKDVFEVYGDYVIMDLFEARDGIGSWGFSYIETGRTAPIRLKELINERYHLALELPEGYKLISPAIDISEENSTGSVKIRLEQKGNTIHIFREIGINKLIINYDEFDDFSKIWKAWVNPSLKQVVFKK